MSIIGIQFPVAIALGFFFGRWIDGMFRTAPWATVGFTLCGIAAGFINLFRITAQAERAEQEEARRAAAERALEEGGDDGAEHRGQD